MVRNLLISYGVSADKLSVSFFGADKSGQEADAFGKLNNRRAEVYVQELRVPNIKFPQDEFPEVKKRFSKVFKDPTTSKPYVRDKFFPKPFVFNGNIVQAFTILTEDNLTWGQVSEGLYGVKKYQTCSKNCAHHFELGHKTKAIHKDAKRIKYGN